MHAHFTMKVIIFRDYKEENWHSMEVYADELIRHLRLLRVTTLAVCEHVTLPSLSALFPASYKYMRQFFRYIVNPVGSLFQRGDIFHISDHANTQLLLVLDPTKTIVTCHDLTAPYWMMEHVPLTRKKRIRHAVERWRLSFLRQARGIIAVSYATKQHIVEALGIPESRITVIPEGVDKLFSRISEKKKLREVVMRLGLPHKFILHVGTTYYNKNIEGLLQIFFSLAKHDADLYLVKAGDWWTPEQEDMIRKSGLAKRILHVGFVDTVDLPSLYSLARVLIQPSYAEGFGFTVLEAMACGCPVVVSDIPAMREMVQDAGVYIAPSPTKQHIREIESLIASKTKRKTMMKRGYRRAATYSWDKAARKTYSLYRKIITAQKV